MQKPQGKKKKKRKEVGWSTIPLQPTVAEEFQLFHLREFFPCFENYS